MKLRWIIINQENNNNLVKLNIQARYYATRIIVIEQNIVEVKNDTAWTTKLTEK